MKIIAYRAYNDIDVQFEDGTIVTNKTYGSFKTGGIPYSQGKNRVGEINTTNNGIKMKIIAYRNANDIDVQFEDGTIVRNKRYYMFKKGAIGHPDCKLGEMCTSSNGMKMKIIAYRGNRDIDIQFEDGTVVCNKTYDMFKKGYIGYPRKNRLGEVNISNNGMKMKIVAYRNANDIDIQFEDGTVVCNVAYHNFQGGKIAHPLLTKSKIFYGYKIVIKAYARGNEVYYLCEKDGNGRAILSPQQMLKNSKVDVLF